MSRNTDALNDYERRMTADRAALVEKVAKLLSSQRGWSWDWMKPSFKADQRIYATAAIDLIRAEVLEEAAGVAAGHDLSIMSMTREDAMAQKIAAAIRALKEKA